MKKTARNLETEKVKLKHGLVFELHDDTCPFYADKDCTCAPAWVEISDAQIEEFFREMGFQTESEEEDHELKKVPAVGKKKKVEKISK